MASVTAIPTFCSFPRNGATRVFTNPPPPPPTANSLRSTRCIKAMSSEKPLEELYNVRVERNVSPERLAQLGVSRWSIWKTGKCRLPWDWQADQLVYIEEGEVRVVPEGSQRYMRFVAGDLLRYPKWFEADLWFNGFYQERYSFRAFGDDYLY